MFAKKVAVAALIAGTALPGLVYAAPTASPAHCVLHEHRVTKVQPLRAVERNGRGTHERLAGAQVFVQAEPGLTAEWLQLTIQRHMAQMGAAGMANCPLDTKDVKASVRSAGPGFAIEITGKNANQAKEILRRAELLLR